MRYPTRVAGTFLLAAVVACGTDSLEDAKIGGAAGDASGGSLLPRAVLFAPDEFSSPTISPDAQRIAFIAPDPNNHGVENVWVAPIRDLSQAKPITNEKMFGIKKYQWATDRYVLYLQDSLGDENWRLYQVDVASGQARELTEEFPPGVQTKILGSSPADVLVGVNHRDPRFHDLYRIDLASGKRTLVWQNTGFASYEVDAETSNVRVALRPEPDGSVSVHERRDPAGGFTPAFEIPYTDTQTTQVLGSDPARRMLFLADSRGAAQAAGTAALVEMNLDSGATRVLVRDEQADITEIVRHPGDGHVQAAIATYDRRRTYILDREFGAMFDAVTTAIRKHEKIADDESSNDVEVTIASRSHNDRLWIVKSVASDRPEKYFLFDKSSGQTSELGGASRALSQNPSRLTKTVPVVIPSRDGLPLVSYLTIPHGSPAAAKNPLVVVVHGGPWERDEGGFDRSRQWLANRGYASLAVNFRSSVGLGKRLVNAGDREWGAKMNDDLVDAVNWAVQKGVADPRRVALLGASYGGYASVTGLAVSPTTFACGVDLVGPTNLSRFFTKLPPYWEGQIDNTALRVGDHRTAEGQAFLTARSPVTFADKIRRPLLIAHGANDPRVNIEESEELANAMKAKSLDVTYATYSDEGHGFRRTENKLAWSALVESFLAKCLNGAEQPPNPEELTGSSMTLKLGTEKYPTLAAALPTLLPIPTTESQKRNAQPRH